MADSSFTDVPRQLKVFVGGLSQNSSRESLNAYFGQYDPFVDCYIMKDGRTGRSRGFAFANFADESAMEMLLQLEHMIDGVPVTLSPYNQGKSKGGYKGRPVMQQARPPVVQVVGPANNQNQSVQSVLGVVNNLLSQQPGGAEVAGALNNAVNAILQQPPTQPVPVMQQQMEQSPQGEFKIFVGGLSQETTKESLSAYFSQYGQADAYVMKDGSTGRSRGFAFVNFQEQSAVNTVLQLEHQIDGVAVQCSQYRYGGGKGGGGKGGGGGGFAGGGGGGFVATPRIVPQQQQQQHYQHQQQQHQQQQQRQQQQPGGYGLPPGAASSGGFQSCKLFVAQLADTADETALQGAFSRYSVTRVTVCRDASGQPKGFGVVEFSSPADAEAAMAMQPVIDGQQTEVTEYYQKQQRPARSNPY